MVQTFIRYIIGTAYKPLLVKYLSRSRRYSSNGITLEIPPQVFHPGFFFSTRLLLNAVCKLPLKGKTLLELGAGSGLIAMQTARRGALVTASDINAIAIENLERNIRRNGIKVRVIHSDLFDSIPLEAFDLIAINPPYYKQDPQSPADHAWFCGKKGEYFERLFNELGNYMHDTSAVLMVLCDGCDLDMINSMAAARGFRLNCIQQSRTLLEKNFIFRIERI